MDNKSLSHTRYKCQYHIVFIPKSNLFSISSSNPSINPTNILPITSAAIPNPRNKIHWVESIEEKSKYLVNMFGKNGWICSKCSNFNYESRKKCNRCGDDKNPRTLSEIKRKKEESNKNEKKKKEHKKDWVCSACGNLNYGFRKSLEEQFQDINGWWS